MATIYELPLPDGTIVEVEGDREPTREEWMRAIGPKFAPSTSGGLPVVADVGLLSKAQREAGTAPRSRTPQPFIGETELGRQLEYSAFERQKVKNERAQAVRARNRQIENTIGTAGLRIGVPVVTTLAAVTPGAQPAVPALLAIGASGVVGEQLAQVAEGRNPLEAGNIPEQVAAGLLAPIGVGATSARGFPALIQGLSEGLTIAGGNEAARAIGAGIRGEEYHPDLSTAINFGLGAGLGTLGRAGEVRAPAPIPKTKPAPATAAGDAAQAASQIKQQGGANAQATLTQLSMGQATSGIAEDVPTAGVTTPVDDFIAGVRREQNTAPAAKERILQQLVDDVSLAEAQRDAARWGVEVDSKITEAARRRVLKVRQNAKDVDEAIERLTTRLEESTPAPIEEVRPTTQERRATPQAETERFNKRQKEAYDALTAKGVPAKEAREAARALAGTTNPQEYQLLYQGALERFGKAEKIAPATKATTRQLRNLEDLTPEAVGLPPAAVPEQALVPEPAPISNALPEPTPAIRPLEASPQAVVQESPQVQAQAPRVDRRQLLRQRAAERGMVRAAEEPLPDFTASLDIESSKRLLSPSQLEEVNELERLRYMSVARQGPEAGYKPYAMSAAERQRLNELGQKYRAMYVRPSSPEAPILPASENAPIVENAPSSTPPASLPATGGVTTPQAGLEATPRARPLSMRERERLGFLDRKFTRTALSEAEEAERRTLRGRARALGEMGGVSRELLNRLGAPAIGAAIGTLQGETPEERLAFAAAGAISGLAGTQVVRMASRGLRSSGLGKTLGDFKKFGREALEDNRIRFLQSLQERGGKSVEREARRAMELAAPSAEGRMRSFFKEEVPKFREYVSLVARNRGLSEADAEYGMKAYAYARHARDYNGRYGDGAAGITNDEANAILTQYAQTGEDEFFEAGADWIRDVFREGLVARREAGIISQDTFDKLTKQYPNYVSLERILPDAEDEIVNLSLGRPRGPEVLGTGIKRAKGSQDLEVKDLFETAISNLGESYRRAALNKANNVAFADVLQNPDRYDGLFSVRKIFPEKKVRMDGGRRVEYMGYPDPTENEFKFYKDGKPVYVRFEDKDMLAALRNVRDPAARTLLALASTPNRLMSMVYTAGSTAFPVRQFFRDPFDVAYNIDALFGGTAGAQVIKEQVPSLKALVDYATINMAPRRAVRGAARLVGEDVGPWDSMVVGSRDNPELNLVREFYEDGGSTGGLVATASEMSATLFDDVSKLAKALPKTGPVLTRALRVTPDAAASFFRVIGGVNRMIEDAPRFSAYKVARQRGMTRPEAAAIARQSTFDPARRGTLTDVASAYYIFFNPALQSAKRILKSSARSPATVAKAAAVIGGAYWAAHMWNNAVWGEGWRDKIDGYASRYTIPIAIPSENGDFNYAAMPVSPGVMPLLKVAQLAADAGQDGKIEPAGTVARDLTESVVEAYSPIPLTEGLSAALTPSFTLPLAQVERNMDAFDRRIMPEGGGADQQYQHQRYSDSTPRTRSGRIAIDVARRAFEKTGGAVDYSPDALLYLWRSYLGDPGKLTRSMIDLPASEPGEYDQFAQIVPKDRETWLPAALPVSGAILRSVPSEIAESRGMKGVVSEEARKEEATFQAEYSRRVRELGRIIANTVPEQRRDVVQTMVNNGAFVYGDVSPEEVFDSVINYAMSQDKTIPDRQRQIARAIAQSPVRGGFRAREIARLYKETPESERPAFAQAFILEQSDEVLEQLLELIPPQQ